MRERAYAASRSMTWARTAERYMTAFENARHGHRLKVIARAAPDAIAPHGPAVPDMQLGHFLSMCDDTGLFQHAVHSVPDRAHGYCVDDNARALLLACALNEPGEHPLSESQTGRFAAFVQHAWNPDTRRFATSWVSTGPGLKMRAPRTVTGEPCGRSANARERMPAGRGADGRRPCLPKPCRPPRRFARLAPSPSRCSVWTPIAPQLRRSARP
jgi:hypothetical protein